MNLLKLVRGRSLWVPAIAFAIVTQSGGQVYAQMTKELNINNSVEMGALLEIAVFDDGSEQAKNSAKIIGETLKTHWSSHRDDEVQSGLMDRSRLENELAKFPKHNSALHADAQIVLLFKAEVKLDMNFMDGQQVADTKSVTFKKYYILEQKAYSDATPGNINHWIERLQNTDPTSDPVVGKYFNDDLKDETYQVLRADPRYVHAVYEGKSVADSQNFETAPRIALYYFGDSSYCHPCKVFETEYLPYLKAKFGSKVEYHLNESSAPNEIADDINSSQYIPKIYLVVDGQVLTGLGQPGLLGLNTYAGLIKKALKQ